MSRTVSALVAAGLVVSGALAFASRAQAPAAAQMPAPAGHDWRSFAATWSATGQLESLPTAGGGAASIVHFSGAVVVTTGIGLSRGFRGDAIAFDDGRALTIGRSVWTDQHGDQIFSEMRGEPVQTGRRLDATITGGTGRYVGIDGSFTLTWQYVVNPGDGTIQGRTAGLEGRYRHGTGQR